MREILAQEADLELYDLRMAAAARREQRELQEQRRFLRTSVRRETTKSSALNVWLTPGPRGRHSKTDWQQLVQICGNSCVRCRAQGRVEKDHIVPLYQGGCDCIGNLQPLCPRCNSSKGAESIDFRPAGWSSALSQ